MSMTAFELGVGLNKAAATLPVAAASGLLTKLRGGAGNTISKAKDMGRRAFDYGANLVGAKGDRKSVV